MPSPNWRDNTQTKVRVPMEERPERILTTVGFAWPELLGSLFQASQSQDPAQRENAFRIFSTTPQIIEKQHEDVVVTAFKGGFADSETSVRTLAQRIKTCADIKYRCESPLSKHLRPSSGL
jgi:hypothetical protein